jgi:ABC-type sugar transport system ATPase subunit
MSLIDVKDIFLKFNNEIILNNISCIIEDKEVFVITGKSGCGTTSFLKLIAGLLFPNKGKILIDGKNLLLFNKKMMLEYHKKCGFVFQNAALISNMNIYDNITLYFHYHSLIDEKTLKRKVSDLINKLGISDDLESRPAQLSIGEKRLVSIARALIHEPETIFWDEPDSNLDLLTLYKIKQIILELKNQKKTMVIATHNIEFAMSIADKIAILDKGKFSKIYSREELEKENNVYNLFLYM